jgi:hypothetical protein
VMKIDIMGIGIFLLLLSIIIGGFLYECKRLEILETTCQQCCEEQND